MTPGRVTSAEIGKGDLPPPTPGHAGPHTAVRRVEIGVDSRAFDTTHRRRTAIAADGTIYASVQDANVLVALNSAGSLKWIAGYSGDPVVDAATGTIYLSDGNHLTALNPDGSLEWQMNVTSFFSEPALGADGTIERFIWERINQACWR